jgi:putative ABC transport system permease protein
MRQGGRGLAGGSGSRTRSFLVLAETTLAFALVIGAGLLIRSFGELRSVDPGFRAGNALTYTLALPTVRYGEAERISLFWEQLAARTRAIPGVTEAGAVNNLPLGGGGMTITFDVEGRPLPPAGEEPVLQVRVVTPGYFDAMGIPLLRGRLLQPTDRPDAPPVALLSEAAVAQHFPGEDPIGRRIVLGFSQAGEPVQGEVVGIVGNVRHGALRAAAQPEIYLAQSQLPRTYMSMVVRTDGDPALLATAVTAAVHTLDPALAVSELRTLQNVVAASVATDRFMTVLLTTFSVLALLLAAVGIFGVISYGVVQRRREIGVRLAVGASQGDVVRLIVGGAMRLVAAGMLIGAATALVLTRLLGSLLYGVQPTDPATFAAAASVLLSVALAASVLPAWRAARTSPASVLNAE